MSTNVSNADEGGPWQVRGKKGRYVSTKKKRIRIPKSNVVIDHNYASGHVCDGDGCEVKSCPNRSTPEISSDWKEGRRIIELEVLLQNLKYCKTCNLGPMTLDNIVGELRKGLGGYLYVKCANEDCGAVNTYAYGKTYHQEPNRKKSGMPCFVVNTKLGTAMIDCLGGPDRVNNFLSTLNIPTINNRTLKEIERRAGESVENVAKQVTKQAAQEAFNEEMNDISTKESGKACKLMGTPYDEDLGVYFLSDTSTPIKDALAQSEVIGFESDEDNGNSVPYSHEGSPDATVHNYETICGVSNTPMSSLPSINKYPKKLKSVNNTRNALPVKLSSKFKSKTRSGMTCAVDTAWHKRGFDSLTAHTFFMSKKEYGKKVLKAVVSHRTCGICKWWKRKRPGQKVRKHRCVFNHKGSARSMESTSGLQGIREFINEGISVEYLEGDGDTTLMAHLHSDLGLNVKKRFDKNHVVKNITKSLYALQDKKLSKAVISHIQKCLKYVFSKNQGNRDELEVNLRALIPHQFGDHSMCQARFCGFKRKPDETYRHRSLPYKSALKDENLRKKLEKVFEPVIANSSQYADLGSSQQCEHANREVTLRAPKSLHYGNSESLDFRVHATAAFINEGRNYITMANEKAGISPGHHTRKYAVKRMTRRQQLQEKSQLPSTKRRRLALKQERAITQGAQEALEGDTYQSGIGHRAAPDIEKLPDPILPGNFSPVELPSAEMPSFITFDLETTDLIRGRRMPHIVQIAAFEQKTGSKFNVYVTPKLPQTPAAQQVTGIVSGNSGMTVNGQKVEPKDIATAIDKFIEWLQKFTNVFLLAHNGRRFDFPILMTACQRNNLVDKLCSAVVGCVDTIPLFKKFFPKQNSYKQEDLYKFIVNREYSAHNALEDVKALNEILEHSCTNQSDVLAFSHSLNAITSQLVYNEEIAKNFATYQRLVDEGVISKCMGEKIAGSGLTLKHLEAIVKRDGEDGLRNTFLSRVKATKKTLDTTVSKLLLSFEQPHE